MHFNRKELPLQSIEPNCYLFRLRDSRTVPLPNVAVPNLLFVHDHRSLYEFFCPQTNDKIHRCIDFKLALLIFAEVYFLDCLTRGSQSIQCSQIVGGILMCERYGKMLPGLQNAIVSLTVICFCQSTMIMRIAWVEQN